MKTTGKETIIPLVLTIVAFLILTGLLASWITILNLFPGAGHIKLLIQPIDILVGMTIYLKTSIDFVIFMGNLMRSNPGWKKRIAIEAGTALGNATGTILVLGVWFFFKEAPALMMLMVFFASLVLLRMAQEGLESYQTTSHPFFSPLAKILATINRATSPVLSRILPEKTIGKSTPLPFSKLFRFSFSVPFILGLDDFAGYIPLFSIINVFGFSIGVLGAHMLINIALFASPKVTTRLVQLPLMLILGSLAFIAIALWGFYDIGVLGIQFFVK